MTEHIAQAKKLVIFVCSLLTLTLVLSQAYASLPPLTRSELADLVLSYQSRIDRIRVKYTATYGSLKDNQVSKGLFIPDSPQFIVNLDSASDFDKGIEYLREEQADEVDYECSFDGKTGMQLTRLPSIRLTGRIMARKPRKLKPEGTDRWRAEEAAYRPIEEHDLATIIRDAKNLKIEFDHIDGQPCYKVTLLFSTKRIIEVKGKQKVGELPRFYRLWLAPEFNMLPVRFERLRQNKDDPFKINLDEQPSVIRQQSDFREVAPGIWFPFHWKYIHTWRDHKPAAVQVDVNTVAVNQDAVIPSRVSFPRGVFVIDEIKGLKYRVGLSDEI